MTPSTHPRDLPRAVAGGSSSPATPLAVDAAHTGSGEGLFTPNARAAVRVVAPLPQEAAALPPFAGQGAQSPAPMHPVEASARRLIVARDLHRARRAHKPTKRLMARLRTLTAIAAKG